MTATAAARAGVPALLIALDPGPEPALDAAAASQRLADALAMGADGILVRPGAVAPAVVDAFAARLPVTAVLPNMPQLLRDAAERGGPRAALDRLRRGGPAAFLHLALTGVRHARAAAAQDFRGLVPILLELERAALGACTLRAVVLAAPLTDLLLAARHRECVAHVVDFVHRRFGVAAGFETSNVGHLLPRLAEWDVSPDFVLGPVNPCGHRMKPSAAEVLTAVRGSRTPVVATDVTAAGRVAPSRALEWARAHGAAGTVLALADVALAAERL